MFVRAEKGTMPRTVALGCMCDRSTLAHMQGLRHPTNFEQHILTLQGGPAAQASTGVRGREFPQSRADFIPAAGTSASKASPLLHSGKAVAPGMAGDSVQQD